MTTLNDAQCDACHYDQNKNHNNGNGGTGEYRFNAVASATIDGQKASSLVKTCGRLNSKSGRFNT
jgi:hypothetical protein